MFEWRVTLCYTFLVNVTTSLVFTFAVLNIRLSYNWVNLVFQCFIQNNGSWWSARYVHLSCRYVAYCNWGKTLILSFCSDCLKLRKVWNLENVICTLKMSIAIWEDFGTSFKQWTLNIYPIIYIYIFTFCFWDRSFS